MVKCFSHVSFPTLLSQLFSPIKQGLRMIALGTVCVTAKCGFRLSGDRCKHYYEYRNSQVKTACCLGANPSKSQVVFAVLKGLARAPAGSWSHFLWCKPTMQSSISIHSRHMPQACVVYQMSVLSKLSAPWSDILDYRMPPLCPTQDQHFDWSFVC